MKLFELLKDIPHTVIKGTVLREITALTYDSRRAVEGCVFVCISGALWDAHTFIPEAIRQGAVAVVVEKDVIVAEDVTVIRVENTRHALALMSAAWFGHPAEKLITIGVTGTKGKTDERDYPIAHGGENVAHALIDIADEHAEQYGDDGGHEAHEGYLGNA